MRWMRVAPVALLVLPAATALALDEAMDIEVAAVLERVKSPDAVKRTQAVNELIGLRMSVSDALKAIVADANAGLLKDTNKVSAIVLMGGMGLADCAQVLEQEQDWNPNLADWKGATGDARAAMARHETRQQEVQRLRYPAQGAARSLGMGSNLRVEPGAPRAGLSLCPSLAAALSKLRSDDPNVCFEGEKAVSGWYLAVENGLDSILALSEPDEDRQTSLYGSAARLTAVHLVGEFRLRHCSRVRKCIDLRDTAGVTASYACSLAVDIPDAEYPAAIAFAKCGRRAWAAILGDIWSDRTAQEGRERLARTLVAIDPEGAKALFRETMAREAASNERKQMEKVAAIFR